MRFPACLERERRERQGAIQPHARLAGAQVAALVKAGAYLSKAELSTALTTVVEHSLEMEDAFVARLVKALGMDKELDTDKRTCRIILRGAKLERFRKLEKTYGRFLGRYKLAGVIVHSSGTCIVIFAEDVLDNVQVALKLMCDKEQWQREQEMRSLSGGAKLSSEHVMQLLDAQDLSGVDAETLQSWKQGDGSDRFLMMMDRERHGENAFRYLLVMPQANRDLSDLLSHDRVAGHKLDEVRDILKQVAGCLHYLHSACCMIHGDIKSRNIVEVDGPDGTALWKLIDLDAACRIGDDAGQKITSNACFPPEMARYELEKAQSGDAVRVQPPTATAAFEVFSFGLLVFQICTRNAETLWQTNQADEMVNWDTDSRQLAYHFEEMKLQVSSRIADAGWSAAADLCLWCLQPRADRRPQRMLDVLNHPFFDDADMTRRLHFLEDQQDSLAAAVVRRANELHTAIQNDDVEVGVAAVQRLLGSSCVHYGLCLQGDELTDAQKSITPLHRAARYGRLEVVRVLLDEVHDEARAPVMDAVTLYDHTALHWAVLYGHSDVAAELLTRGCNTDLVNHRGKTAWDLAVDCDDKGVLAVFDDAAPYEKLRIERIRRARRPKVNDTFCDDIELAPARLDFWSIEPFDQWEWKAEGAYGQVYSTQTDPDIEIEGRRFRRVALKAPNVAPLEIGVEDLKREIESLHRLTHKNIVQILGMVHSKTPGSGDKKHWTMALEWCETTLAALLHPDPDGGAPDPDPDGVYKSPAQMCELLEGIAQAVVYIHSQDRPHLDIKPNNVLLARDRATQHQSKTRYIAKLADFGMAYQDDAPAAAPAGAELQRQSGPERRGRWGRTTDVSARGGGDPPVERVFGSFEYMSPECWKREYGTPSAASDIFSLGLVMWEMLARRRISDFLLDENNPDHTCVDKNGKTVLDVAVVPVLLVKGERPRFTGLLPEVREQCGWPVYYRLMQACWVADIKERPTAARVAEALRLAKSYTSNATPEQKEQEVAALNGEAAVTYDDFLATVGLQDKKEELAEYLTADAELEELKQYDEDELDEDILDDLGLGDETKTQFHEALRSLQQAPAADEPMAAWPTLQKMLPGLRGLQNEAQPLELAATHS